MTGKITGNAVGDGEENSKTLYIILSVFVVVMLIIVLIAIIIKFVKLKQKKVR